jgi:glycerophosphoryl diester phosphodiesterase
VNVWTVNNAADIKAMFDLGVSSIITDDPALAMSLSA